MYAGIDLGATNLRAAVADADGEIVAVVRRRTPRGTSGDAVTEAVLDALRDACADAGIAAADARAAGIGSIGPLDLDAGAVARGVNLPADGPIPLRDPIAALIDGPVRLCNDAVAGVVGERRYADAPGNAVYLTISTGIGAGAVVDGHVLSGRDGNAAEVGHFVVDPAGRLTCGCGRDGHWEAYCSGANLPDFVRLLGDAEPVDTALSPDDLAAADVFANPDDPLAARAIDRVARYNAAGVANTIHAFAPDLIAIGGAVALSNPGLVIEPIRERVPELVAIPPPTIRETALGGDAVLRGAVALALGER